MGTRQALVPKPRTPCPRPRRTCGPRSRPGSTGPGGAPTCSPTRSTTPTWSRQHSPLMSPLVWDLAHIGNYEELWLLRDVGGREPMRRRRRRPLRRVPAPAARAGRRCRCSDPAEARAYVAEVRERGARRARPRDRSTGRPAARRRLRLRHGRPARAPARRDDARHPSSSMAPPCCRRRRRRPPGTAAAGRRSPRRPARCCVAGGPFAMGTDRAVGATTTSGRRTPSTSAPFRIDTAPVTNGAVPRVRRRRRLRRAALVEPTRAGRGGTEAGLVGAAVLARATAAAGCATGFGRDRAARRSTSRCSTSAGTRPTPTPAGPAGGCPPRPSGRRRPAGTRAAAGPALPVGRRRPDPGAGQPGPAAPAAGPGRRVPGRCQRRWACEQMIGDVWEWTASRLRRRTRASSPSRTASTPRCSSAPSTRCCAAARGRPTRSPCRATFRNWDYPIRRQIFAGFRCARDVRCGTRRGRLMCRHLAYLGPPVTLGALLLDPPHSLFAAGLAPRHQDARRRSTPTASASAGTYRAIGRAGPLPQRRPMWTDDDVRRRWPGVVDARRVLAAVRSATRRACPVDEPAAAPFVDGRWLFSPQRLVRRLARRRRDELAAHAAAGTPGPRWTAPTDSEVLFGARAATGSTAGTPSGRGAGRGRRARGRGRPAQPAAHRRRRDRGHPLGGNACGSWRRDTGVVVASEPLDDDPGWTEVPDTSPARRRRSARRSHPDLTSSMEPSVRSNASMTTFTSTCTDRPRRRSAARPTSATGLTAQPKSLPPKWFYDDRGSELFDEITRPARVLPDPHRARRSSPRAPARSPTLTGADTLVELGSGTSEKTAAAARRARAARAAARGSSPFDVSEPTLRGAADAARGGEYPGVAVHAVVGDFERHLGQLPGGGRAAGRVPRRHDRQPRPGRAGRFLAGARGRARAGRRASCSAPTW